MKYIYALILAGILSLFINLRAASEELGKEPEQPESTDSRWLKIFHSTHGIGKTTLFPLEEVDSIYFLNSTDYFGNGSQGYEGATQMVIATIQEGLIYKMGLDSILKLGVAPRIPTLYIDTDSVVDEIPDKVNYLQATFSYEPADGSDTLTTSVSVRGRGNSSWFFPKKPYRLKFDKKQSIGNLNKAKSFVLISNYIDNTLMRNSIAFKISELAGMPFANVSQPVNLVLNGEKRGSYLLTNKTGINSGSVDIDEKEGVLWEMDTYLDEEYQFISDAYNLPCMLKDPDPLEIAANDTVAAEEIWSAWKEDLNKALLTVESGHWEDAFDAEQFVKYILVCNIMQNSELEHPKSFFLYKENKDARYKLGPVWDFDWSMGYNMNMYRTLLTKGSEAYNFFYTIFSNYKFKMLFKEEFDRFCEQSLPQLLEFIDEYALLIGDSAAENAALWTEEHYLAPIEHREINTRRFLENVDWIKQWLLTRIDFIKNHPNHALY